MYPHDQMCSWANIQSDYARRPKTVNAMLEKGHVLKTMMRIRSKRINAPIVTVEPENKGQRTVLASI